MYTCSIFLPLVSLCMASCFPSFYKTIYFFFEIFQWFFCWGFWGVVWMWWGIFGIDGWSRSWRDWEKGALFLDDYCGFSVRNSTPLISLKHDHFHVKLHLNQRGGNIENLPKLGFPNTSPSKPASKNYVTLHDQHDKCIFIQLFRGHYNFPSIFHDLSIFIESSMNCYKVLRGG